ncbi:FMN-binding glutamate synthase family protein [Leptospira perolatii]|uniref:FMN-binding glutamate synthase family protein n=1 Tax=Leptospira perolatii TaxID=2023191 RepID=A0A2M9ZP61_9LEPT|nr:FMN-binding glutamate synthase family protein [Leptospira perolatii]PJZ70900.1 FMN-binding glutamate synthase family protein [Leptospira perolatii]PJZ73795.1 FMN-binding glutamate synthase family protein [Leptospira perolatii]
MVEETFYDLLMFVEEHPWIFTSIVIGFFLVGLLIHDLFQRRHTIKHNFPIVGHLRYIFETIGPELRQYWVANDKEEMPFSRAERSWVYATAKKQNNNFGFGTTELLYDAGYPIIKHAAFPFPDAEAKFVEGDPSMIPSLKVMGEFHKRKKLYRPASVINISAMSFGSLGERAVSALNKGAKIARCYQNTGEGGLSPYHNFGADVMWQLGTGYFGARGPDGKFSLDMLLKRLEQFPTVRAIEIKLSQGAKPGKGGILPGAKVTKQIAEIRGIEPGKDCVSPNAHSEFRDVKGLIHFIEMIAEASGLPVGIKSAVGESKFWDELSSEMLATGKGPDFITIDGGEGGTGAAPLTFTDHVSLPFKVGFARVYRIFQAKKLSDRMLWIGSGKLGFPDRSIVAFAMGCDLIHVAREAMMSVGCIQAQKCHTGHCPAGVATQSRWLQAGLDVELKAERAANFIKGLRKELLSVAHACGYEHPLQFTGRDIEIGAGQNRFRTLEEVLEYERDPVKFTTMMDYASYIPALS